MSSDFPDDVMDDILDEAMKPKKGSASTVALDKEETEIEIGAEDAATNVDLVKAEEPKSTPLNRAGRRYFFSAVRKSQRGPNRTKPKRRK